MESLIVSINAVLPVFLMIALGYLLRRIKLVDDDLVSRVNKLVFRVFLPIMLFNNIYTSDLKSVFNPKLVIFAPLSIIVIFTIATIFVVILRKENKRRGAMIQALFRSNYVILGIPIVKALFGDEVSAVPSLLAAFIVPIFNLLAVITLEVFRGSKPDLLKIIKSIIKNPLIIASLLGFAFNLLEIKFPAVIASTISTVGSVATPLPLVMLGAFFRFESVKNNIKDIAICTIGRLIVSPLIGSVIALMLGFRGVEFASLLIMFSAPPAIASFTMAQQMDSEYQLSGEAVIVSSALSCFTIFLWILLYTSLGVI